MNEIVGGTGKYAGIQGNGPWKCKSALTIGCRIKASNRYRGRLPSAPFFAGVLHFAVGP